VQPPLLFRATAAALVLAALGGISLGWLIPKMQVRAYSLVYAREFPVCAAQWLKGAPEPLKIFNQYGEGGYLVYELSSRGDKLYIFGDAAVMGDALLYQYAKVETAEPSWDSIIRGAGTDVVLYDVNTPLADLMERIPGWVKVYQDSLSIAFVPSDKVASLHLPPQPASYPPGSVCAQLAKSPAGGAQS